MGCNRGVVGYWKVVLAGYRERLEGGGVAGFEVAVGRDEDLGDERAGSDEAGDCDGLAAVVTAGAAVGEVGDCW